MKKVYVVKRNADFTEGRGPMLLHCIFQYGNDAVEYVKAQGGIFGSPQRVEMNKYGHYAYANGYEIDEVEVLDSVEELAALEFERLRKKGLEKLTKQEAEALGLRKV